MPAPRVWRVLIRAGRWVAPTRARSAWHAKWAAELANWWLLVERGELAGGGGAVCRQAFGDAFGERFGGVDIRQIVRGPMFVAAAILAAVLLLAALSHGFAVTRSLAAIARELRNHPVAGAAYDWRGDRIAAYLAPIFLAVATGMALLTMGCLPLRARGWRYWSFLALKVAAVFVLLPLVWVECGTALRSHIPSGGWRVAAGVAMAFVFVGATGRAILWTIADQRRRCPACLRRLILPVTVGSWGSLFEPAATEMLCEDGHGALALWEGETNGGDRWTELDASWRALFH